MSDLSNDEPQRYYIGKDKPKIEVSRHPKHWEGKLYPLWQLKDEADNLPESPEQAGWDGVDAEGHETAHQ